MHWKADWTSKVGIDPYRTIDGLFRNIAHSAYSLPDTIHSPPKAILLPRAKISYSNRLQPQRREPLGFSFALIFENLFRTIGNRIGNAWSPRLRLGLGSFGKVP
jgi:hypothetical protein